MAIVHHADSFALIRKGMVDVTVMGAYEVAENGDQECTEARLIIADDLREFRFRARA